jgi:muramoyltetrapeptide carboxypeptidase
VAVVSPSSPVPSDRLDAGIAVLDAWGLRVVEGQATRTAQGHLAGSDEQRAADFNAAIRDPAVRAVWASRGGYGATRIINRVDWRALRADPKLLIGFSDVTALLVAAWQRCGLVTVHGQFVARLHRQHQRTREALRRMLFGAPSARVIAGGAAFGARGRVEGPLVGGNLAVLTALIGTSDELRAAGCVLLLEEVAEAPYRVDRMLTQLRASSGLGDVRGIALGRPVACDPEPNAASASFAEVITDRFGDLGVPILTGLPVGHTDDQHPVLHGGVATLDTDRLEVRQSATLPAPSTSSSAERSPDSST